MEKQDIILNKTFNHTIDDYSFGNVPKETLKESFKDGSIFAKLSELWLEENYKLEHIPGCKAYDFIDLDGSQYDEKTFTKYGCKFCPSSMLGKGRKFDEEIFKQKATNMIYIIVSNDNFPEIKVKFFEGSFLIKYFPDAQIPPQMHDNIFDDEFEYKIPEKKEKIELTVKQMKEIAKENKIKLKSSFKKDHIFNILKENKLIN